MPTPAAPANFAVARQGIDNWYQGVLTNKPAVRFSFTNNAGPGSTHLIQRKRVDVAGNWVDTARAGDGQSTAEFHRLPLDSVFHFRIRAEHPAQGFSAWVTITGDPIRFPALPTSAARIIPPTELTVGSNDYRGVTLTWLDNANSESLHIVRLTGPGLPGAGVDVPVDHLASGSLALPLGYPFVGAYSLQYDATYFAKVKCRGGKQTTNTNTFETDWTSDVSFTTALPHIAIINLPRPADAPPVMRGEAFSFRIVTNTPATAITIIDGDLPVGLTLTGDTVSGMTVEADGSYEVSIKAEDALTSDTQPLQLRVETPAFLFTNLPAVLTAWVGVPFLFRLLTNTPPTSIALTAGSLPDGLAFADDAIDGTATGAEAAYPATFRAENALTSALGNVLINVQSPAIRVLLKPNGSFLPPQPGPDWGEVIAPLAQLFRWEISAQPVGPINVGDTITMENAPAWLSLNDTSLIGTPDTSGVADILITWSNGTVTGETTLRVRVPAVQITSATELTVLEDEPFEFVLTAQPRAHFSTLDDLPADVQISSPDVGDVLLHGAARDVGDYNFRLIATVGVEQDTQDFTLHVEPLIVVTDEITAWQGDTLIEMLSYRGRGSVVHWFLTGAPQGVEINPLSCPGGPYAEDNLAVVAIAGAPTAAGVFEAVVTAQVCVDGIPRLYRRAVRFLVSGGLFLNWFHDDAAHRDLQVLLRSREVRSYSFGGEEGLWLKRGDHASLHVIFRDGPLGAETTQGGGGNGGSDGGSENAGGVVVIIGSNNTAPGGNGDAANNGAGGAIFGRNLITDIASVKLVIRPAVDPEEIVLLDLAGEATTIAGRAAFVFDFQVSSDELESAIAREARKAAEPPAGVSLACVGEIVWERNGQPASSRSFPATIVQDIAR